MKNNDINRREFVRQTGALVSTALAAFAGSSFTPAPKYKMGLQLFSIRDAMKADAAGTLKKVAAMGYQDLETYGYNPTEVSYYGMRARAFRELLEQHKLTASSGHYDFHTVFSKTDDDLKRYVDQCIVGAKAIGQKYITWPWMDPASRTIAHFKILTQKLNIAGEQIQKAGLGFAYHNHDYEFFDQGGENGYDIIMRETDPALVKLQIDLYWVMHSSALTPAELMAKQPGRFVMWHIKDMDKKTRDYSELGNGSIDYRPILPLAEKAGLQYYFIEQGGNYAVNSMQSASDSALFFKKNLQRYL